MLINSSVSQPFAFELFHIALCWKQWNSNLCVCEDARSSDVKQNNETENNATNKTQFSQFSSKNAVKQNMANIVCSIVYTKLPPDQTNKPHTFIHFHQ